jgi:DNA-binding CsgD family transcriptional regulator
MNEAYNGEHPALTPAQRNPKRHNAKLCSLVIRERIVNALAAGDSQAAIARALRVSRNTVNAVAEQEWSKVEQRKARIAAQSERNATRAAELIAQKLESGEVPLNVLVPVFGVSVDKALALRGDAPQLPQQLSIDHHHIHEFVQRHIRQVPIHQVLDSLPDEQSSSLSHADTPRNAG